MIEARPEICLICQQRAYGYNYEVISCNACKMFFRRVTQRQIKKECKYGGKCFDGKDLANARPQCRACRYRKCIEVGMRCTDSEVTHLQSELEGPSPQSSSTPNSPEPNAIVPRVFVTADHIQSNLLLKLSQLHTIRMEIFGVINIGGDLNFVDLVAQEPKLGDYMKPQQVDWNGKIKPWVSLGTILVVEMCKTMEFYNSLLLSDRVTLLKTVAFKSHMLSVAFDSYTRRKCKMLAPNDVEMIPPVLNHIPGCQKFVEDLLSTPVEPLVELQMSENEYLLLNMMVICDPEIPGLSPSGKELLFNNQRTYSKILLDHCLMTHGRHGPARFAAIIQVTQRLEKMVYLTQKLVFYLRAHFNPKYAPCKLTYDSCRMEKCEWFKD